MNWPSLDTSVIVQESASRSVALSAMVVSTRGTSRPASLSARDAVLSSRSRATTRGMSAFTSAVLGSCMAAPRRILYLRDGAVKVQ